jgi:hypothetical protein
MDQHIGIGWELGVGVQEQQRSTFRLSRTRVHLAGSARRGLKQLAIRSQSRPGQRHGVVAAATLHDDDLNAPRTQGCQRLQGRGNAIRLFAHRDDDGQGRCRHGAAS